MRVLYTSQFKKDYKRLKRQGKSIEELRKVVDRLAHRGKLAPRFRDHSLLGKWKEHRECHIRGDWLLIYRLSEDCLCLERTGSHSELFE